MNKAELARMHGVSRSTLYSWLGLPGCPNPDTDPDGFSRFAAGLKFETRGTSRNDPGDIGSLKEKKLRGDVIIRWQEIAEFRAAMESAVMAQVWDEAETFLATLKAELEHLALPDPDAVNRALAAAAAVATDQAGEANRRYEARLVELKTLICTDSPPLASSG